LTATQATHLFVVKSRAAFANPNAQAHNGITMDASNALDGSNAGPFRQHRNGQDLLFKRQIVRHNGIGSYFAAEWKQKTHGQKFKLGHRPHFEKLIYY
jgi:hypothetical protein